MHEVGKDQITVDRVIWGGDSVVLSHLRLALVATQWRHYEDCMIADCFQGLEWKIMA